jgi:antibiotic biosynthesis monooxygenase (ABM) superfamily enzyme
MHDIQWIRTGFWQGSPRPDCASQWRAALEELLPAFRAMPGVRDVKACWPDKREDDPPLIACQFILEFASRADLDRMLISPERAAVRPLVQRAKDLFDGHVSHIEYQVA